ncbi:MULTISPECIES: hypothetical protein [unclassified Streptomyces]|uniref:hypothetical protein n=1 Tax=unclassified Streptomyces TaxID=2593676 RepID=UPI002E16F85D|nr:MULTISPECIES: hypothetical protein [unclassified Streptomyces]
MQGVVDLGVKKQRVVLGTALAVLALPFAAVSAHAAADPEPISGISDGGVFGNEQGGTLLNSPVPVAVSDVNLAKDTANDVVKDGVLNP